VKILNKNFKNRRFLNIFSKKGKNRKIDLIKILQKQKRKLFFTFLEISMMYFFVENYCGNAILFQKKGRGFFYHQIKSAYKFCYRSKIPELKKEQKKKIPKLEIYNFFFNFCISVGRYSADSKYLKNFDKKMKEMDQKFQTRNEAQVAQFNSIIGSIEQFLQIFRNDLGSLGEEFWTKIHVF